MINSPRILTSAHWTATLSTIFPRFLPLQILSNLIHMITLMCFLLASRTDLMSAHIGAIFLEIASRGCSWV